MAEPFRLDARSWQGWIWPYNVAGHGVDVAACVYTQDWCLFPCGKVLQQPEQYSSPRGVPGGLSTLSRGDLGAAPPSDPISSSFPQERLGDGPRQSVRTPCAMASSELPPCPAVGTVTSRSWVFWGEESQPCAGRGDITPFPVVLEPHSTTRPRGAIAGVFGWRCSLPSPASLSALWGKSVPG